MGSTGIRSAPPARPATRDDGQSRAMGLLVDAGDLIAFVALLNALLIGFTLAGGVVLGAAPAFAAAVACSRARLRGEGGSVLRRFAGVWRAEFRRATLLQLPSAAAIALLLVNASLLAEAQPAVAVACTVAAAVAALHLVTAVVMDAHYDLTVPACLALAARFLLRSPASPVLLAAALALIALATSAVPGLLPVVALGAAVHLATALCLSFFAANDDRVAASTPSSTTTDDPERNTHA